MFVHMKLIYFSITDFILILVQQENYFSFFQLGLLTFSIWNETRRQERKKNLHNFISFSNNFGFKVKNYCLPFRFSLFLLFEGKFKWRHQVLLHKCLYFSLHVYFNFLVFKFPFFIFWLQVNFPGSNFPEFCSFYPWKFAIFVTPVSMQPVFKSCE